jgi:hypothetical protein
MFLIKLKLMHGSGAVIIFRVEEQASKKPA